jgi:uncharacterized protein (UPF0276 family)
MQLCPQNTGVLNPTIAHQLKNQYPDTEWRLHANVRIANVNRIIDLCDWQTEKAYFRQLADISKALDAPVYSAHAGKRQNASVEDVIRYSKEMTQCFGIPVAIEGHYPVAGNIGLFSRWQEYQLLLESGAYFALDLSHLNILATQTHKVDIPLVAEMLASERCMEIHVSANDGQRDQHLPLSNPPWWWPLLVNAHENAVIFSEGRIAPKHQ